MKTKVSFNVVRCYWLSVAMSQLFIAMVSSAISAEFRNALLTWFPNADTCQAFALEGKVVAPTSVFGLYPSTNQLIAIEGMIALLLNIAVVCLSDRDRYLPFFTRHFNAIMLFEAIVYSVISFVSLELSPISVLVRMFGFALFSTAGCTVWKQVMKNAWNQIYIRDDATRFGQKCELHYNWGCFFGYGIMAIIGNVLTLKHLILIQWFGFIATICVEVWVFQYVRPDRKHKSIRYPV